MNLKKSSGAQCRSGFDKKFTQLSITVFVHQVPKYIWDLKDIIFNTGLNMQSVTSYRLFMQVQLAGSVLNWTNFIIRLYLVLQNVVEEETKLANSSTR